MRALSHTILAIGFGLATLASAQAAPYVAFADSFDDGSVADWSVSASGNISSPVVTVRTDAFVSGPGALWTYFDAPGGGTGAGTVRASHGFNAPVTADYTLTLSARSAPCGGCTMSYDVLVDGVSLTRTFSPSAFQLRTFTLTGLTAGAHILTLGMHTDAASSGRFQASFDDVSITTLAPVPEPATYAMFLAGFGLLAASARRRRAI
jgi:hypothetical protein